VNTGLLLCNPRKLLPVFDFVQKHLPSSSDSLAQNAHFEQALFNFGVQAFRADSLVTIPEDWNYIEPDIRLGRMSHFVYHFTGPRPSELRRAIRSFPWTLPLYDGTYKSFEPSRSVLPTAAQNQELSDEPD
jgi:hypothetical protein